MKYIKNIELFESRIYKDRLHVFAEFSRPGFKHDIQDIPEFYIFEDDEDAFNYLANEVYRIYNENNLDLDILDECKEAIDLIENYEEEVHQNHNIKEQTIFYTPTTITRKIVRKKI